MTSRSLLAFLVLSSLITGCAPAREGPAELRIAPGAYAPAFEAAKQVLVAQGFELDRVDARAGVITTRDKASAGLATPWHQEQSTAAQEVEDLINKQHRTARVTFTPEVAAPPQGVEPEHDLRAFAGPTSARVEVAISRWHRPGWRIETSSIQQSRRWRDPALQARGMLPQHEVPFTLDPQLAARIAGQIARKTPGAAPATAAAAEPPRPVSAPSTPQRPSRGRSGYWD